MGRSYLYQKNRNLLRDRTQQTGDTCRFCGGAFRWDVPWYHSLAFTANHIIDTANGGTDELDNLEPAHHKCNTSAGGRLGYAISSANNPPSTVRRPRTSDPTTDPKSQEWP